ncbi:PDR/VanB family oxidoreductase [Prauserella cavernicola]|uniref:Oxidoreductase n=1 Tax=Prauserella cavernicola TaxID=2800127 RepID=A0A934QV74_9PSEU|nr:PDR/VanB family oxidoreductase [Prauserella cavernicola]MBK1787125.1 oxidoreductase [Prauserella cavernicola]
MPEVVDEQRVVGDSEEVRLLCVARKEKPASDVVLLELRDPQGRDLPAWEPGAHIDLLLPGDMVRQYSLCGDPSDRRSWQVAVLREPEGRGGSVHVHDELTEGASLEVRGPRNNFTLDPAESYIFIAGGIGVTPLLPMIRVAQRRGVRWELVYGGRTRASMSFVDELEDRYGESVTVRPQDEFGLLDLTGLLGTVRPGTAVYCCGPEALLQAVENACERWPSGALHVERFAPRQLEEPVLSEAFEVELTQSGMTLSVPPDKSIMGVLEENGVQVVSSCQEGTCGACETVVLSGQPEHRDSLLTPAERETNETMMVCVSRSLCPRLVLDL